MNEERKKILEMLADGKITADEADRLLTAISQNSESGPAETAKTSLPKYLRVMVEPGPESEKADRVNIRVPLKLIRAGLKLASLIPKNAQDKVNQALNEKGIDADLSKIKPDDLDEIIRQLDDISVDVEGKETVKIFCE
jgi:membrane peptidoglycan carboxypeptidase